MATTTPGYPCFGGGGRGFGHTINPALAMPTQVITIAPDGAIHGLVHKRGQGIDLRQFGHTQIERVTLIEWDEKEQAWGIRWVDHARDEDQQPEWDAETFSRVSVDYRTFGGYVMPQPVGVGAPEFPVFFGDYEDAVAAEVAVVQAMQLGHGQKNRPPDQNPEGHDPGAEP